jgi:uncharacterized RDD family membrane protein YckC
VLPGDELFLDEPRTAPPVPERAAPTPVPPGATRRAAPATLPDRHAVSAGEAGKPVGFGPRAAAAVVDAGLLGAIDALVILGTFRVAGLPAAEAGRLPLVPLLAFLALLNGGYLVGFVTAAGQTIGQMVMGHRVVTERGNRVPLAQAVARAAGVVVSVLPFGLGCLPVMLGRGNPALHDRLSRTRVVRT